MKKKTTLASLAISLATLALVPNPAVASPLRGIGRGNDAAVMDHRLVQNVHGWWRRPWGGPYYYGYGYYRPYAYYRPYYYPYYVPYYRAPVYPAYRYCPRYYPYYY
jgi:hypothetical protein